MGSRRHLLFAPLAVAIALGMQACGDDDPANPATNQNDGGTGDGNVDPNGEGGVQERRLSTTPNRGSTIAMSGDDTRLIVANREVGTVSIFSIEWASGRPELTKTAELPVGGEVSQVAMHPTGNFAFALSRIDQKLVKIENVRGTPTVGPTLQTGSEPTGIALTPFGDFAWVANWVDGTVMVVNTATMAVKQTIDLNAALVGTGLLGQVGARPALAHPRSIAITNNGNQNDEDEFAYVTEFYAQQKVPLTADGLNADVAKVGLVYKISVRDPSQVSTIELPPMTDMGFKDHAGGDAGCFPNQLLSININGGFAYVSSICASPKGPGGPFTGPAFAACTVDTTCPGGAAGSCDTVAGRCKTNCLLPADCGANGGVCGSATAPNVCQPNLASIKTTLGSAISIIDLGGAKTIATVNLNKEFETDFAARSIADDGNRTLPMTAMDLGFVPGTVNAYVASKGSDALYRVNFNATYEASTIDSLGTPAVPFIQLAPAAVDPSLRGRLPTGVSVAYRLHTEGSTKRYAFVNSENTRTVSVIDLDAQDLAGRSEGTPIVAQSSPLPTDQNELNRLEGERLFATGLGRWSLKGQSWGGCESCHVDGLSDNVTWFFPRGPRQPNSLDGTFNSKDPSDSRVHNWTAVQDEVSDHEMGAARGTTGGIGAIVTEVALQPANRIAIDTLGHAGLAGSSAAAANPLTKPANLPRASALDDWQHVTRFFQSIRSMKRPTNVDAAKAANGRALFAEGNCTGCHYGAKWTLSKVFYNPDPTNAVNNALKDVTWTQRVVSASYPPALLPASTGVAQTMRFSGRGDQAGRAGGDFDQILCVLRSVGTYNVAEAAVGIAEKRRNMTAAGQGNELDGKGFNPPSLLSMSVGAPYFHAGQVRTLERLLDDPFGAHREALKTGFLAPGAPDRDAKIADLVAFLTSIDEDAEPFPEPALSATGGSFCSTTN